MSQLRPCDVCGRHVRVVEARCPFCDAALALASSPRPHVPRLRRAALFAFGAATTAATTTIAACSSGTSLPTAEGGTTSSEGGSDSASAPDIFVPDTGAVAKPYGAPPADGLFEIV
jgi:hypothetical protein